jgi:hypothetical protein
MHHPVVDGGEENVLGDAFLVFCCFGEHGKQPRMN